MHFRSPSICMLRMSPAHSPLVAVRDGRWVTGPGLSKEVVSDSCIIVTY